MTSELSTHFDCMSINAPEGHFCKAEVFDNKSQKCQFSDLPEPFLETLSSCMRARQFDEISDVFCEALQENTTDRRFSL